MLSSIQHEYEKTLRQQHVDSSELGSLRGRVMMYVKSLPFFLFFLLFSLFFSPKLSFSLVHDTCLISHLYTLTYSLAWHARAVLFTCRYDQELTLTIANLKQAHIENTHELRQKLLASTTKNRMLNAHKMYECVWFYVTLYLYIRTYMSFIFGRGLVR